MKITIYELLGLIKDGKAPKKIKLDGFIFELVNDMYVHDEMGLLDEYISITNQLYTKVEIVNEEDEFIDIEEFKEHKLINTKDILELEMIINKINADYDCKINDLIKNQRLLINKINEKNDKND